MNHSKMPLKGAGSFEIGMEYGKDVKQLSDDNVALSRRFGVMDLWKIRKNARSFRIHNRLPRF